MDHFDKVVKEGNQIMLDHLNLSAEELIKRSKQKPNNISSTDILISSLALIISTIIVLIFVIRM